MCETAESLVYRRSEDIEEDDRWKVVNDLPGNYNNDCNSYGKSQESKRLTP
jgi:hypothetical protein